MTRPTPLPPEATTERSADRLLRVLYVVINAPRPAASGYARRIDAIAQALERVAALRLLVLQPAPDAEALSATAARYDTGFLTPPSRIAARVALDQASAWLAGRDRWLGKYFDLAAFETERAAVACFAPDLVVAGFPNVPRLTRRLGLPLERTIVDHPDPVSINHERRAASAHGLTRLRLAMDARMLREAERECGDALEQWCVSEVDRPEVERLTGAPTHVVPNTVEDWCFAFEAAGVQAGAPTGIGFLGQYGYSPNEEAALSFIGISASLAASGLTHDAWLVGGGVTKLMRTRAANAPQVRIAGFVPDLAPLMARFTLMLAPIRTGSGTKLKILQSMAMGVPVVTTPVGAEGLPIREQGLGLVADSDEDLAAACLRLIADPALRLATAGRARAWARDAASQTGLDRVVAARIAAHTAALAPKQSDPFAGARRRGAAAC